MPIIVHALWREHDGHVYVGRQEFIPGLLDFVPGRQPSWPVLHARGRRIVMTNGQMPTPCGEQGFVILPRPSPLNNEVEKT